MPDFSSNRERRLWVWALAVVVAIYATADLARTLADALRESGLLELTPTMFSAGMLLIGIAILVQGLRERSRGVEVGFALGVAGIAVIGLARGIDAAERSHLIEYAVLALIIHEALVERKAQGWRVPVPAVLAIAATTAVGVVDECIQFFVPSRTFDLFDIGFDLLASVLAVGSSVSIRWVRRWIGRFRPRSSPRGRPDPHLSPERRRSESRVQCPDVSGRPVIQHRPVGRHQLSPMVASGCYDQPVGRVTREGVRQADARHRDRRFDGQEPEARQVQDGFDPLHDIAVQTQPSPSRPGGRSPTELMADTPTTASLAHSASRVLCRGGTQPRILVNGPDQDVSVEDDHRAASHSSGSAAGANGSSYPSTEPFSAPTIRGVPSSGGGTGDSSATGRPCFVIVIGFRSSLT